MSDSTMESQDATQSRSVRNSMQFLQDLKLKMTSGKLDVHRFPQG